jgi:hypothetical protein
MAERKVIVGEDKKKERPPQGDHTQTRLVEGLLNADDMEELRAMAKAAVEKEYKDAERKVVLQRLIDEERGKADPEEEILPILIDLPGHAACIKINQKPYWHSVTYDVPVSIWRSLSDIMAQAWKHEEVVNNVNRARYQPVSRNDRLNARTGQHVQGGNFLRG